MLQSSREGKKPRPVGREHDRWNEWNKWNKWACPCAGGFWAVAPNKTTTSTSTAERLSSRAAEQSSRAAEYKQHSRRAVVGGFGSSSRRTWRTP